MAKNINLNISKKMLIALREKNYSWAAIAERFGCSRQNVYYLKQKFKVK